MARLLQRLLTPAAKRQGFAETAVLADWAEIVGSDMALRCQPLKITRRRGKNEPGTLIVQASPIMSLELQHSAPQIIDRINTYFGFHAIRQLKLVGGHVYTKPSEKVAPPDNLTDTQRVFIDKTSAEIKIEPLRAALAALGAAVYNKARP